MNSAVLASYDYLLGAAHPAFVNRYLSAVALASLLYDHARTFDVEINDVWVSLRVSTGIKLGFLFGRYATDATMLYAAYALSGIADLDKAGCEIRIGTYWAAQACCTATTQGVVIYRLREVFGRKILSLHIIPLSLFCISAIMIGFEIPHFFKTLQYIPVWHTCITEPLTPFYTIAQYSCLAITDVIIILLFLIAVLEIPYKRSGEVIVKLEKEGGWYFVSLFVIHVACILVLAQGKMIYPVALPPAWSLTMIINSRIFHRIGLDKKHADESTGVLDQHPLVRFA